MSDSINLLSNTKAHLGRKKKSVAILRYLSYGSLGFVLLCSVIVFFLKVQSPLSALKLQETEEKKQLDVQNEKIIKHLFIEGRIAEIADILGKRKRHDKTAEALTAGIPSGITISDLSIEDTVIKMSLSGSSLLLLNEAISHITGLVGKDTAFTHVLLENMSYEPVRQNYAAILKITVL